MLPGCCGDTSAVAQKGSEEVPAAAFTSLTASIGGGKSAYACAAWSRFRQASAGWALQAVKCF